MATSQPAYFADGSINPRGPLGHRVLHDPGSPMYQIGEQHYQTQRDEDIAAGRNSSSAFAMIQRVLIDYGLEGLVGQAWDWFQEGISQAEIDIRLENTAEYRQRFQAIFDRRDAGLPPISAAEIVEMERQARQLESLYGLPANFIDTNEALVNDVSLNELNQRISLAVGDYERLDSSARSEFERLFGGGSMGAGLAFFLDPDRAVPELQRQLTGARFAGIAKRTGFGQLSADEAFELAADDNPQQVEQNLGELGTSKQLLTAFDDDDDVLGREDQFAFARGDASARQRFEKLRSRRLAAFNESGGPAATNAGIVGAGAV